MEFIISLVVCIAVTLAVYYFLKQPTSSTSTVTITNGQDGKVSKEFSGVISVSENQGELTFSYAGWVEIDDFTYRFGERKTVFSKGGDDLSSACPALVIDANTNSFLVILDTYGTQEIVPVSNIPAKKWIHVGIVVDQTAINIYINGTLHTHHTLNQIPRQNTGPVHLSPKGGFGGKIGLLQYYPNKLSPSEISGLSTVKPPNVDTNVYPPYFDSTWWIKKPQPQ
jgi:hypothetical protein